MTSDSGLFDHLFNNLPNGWKLKPLQEIVDFQEGPGILAEDFHDEGIPLLRLSSIAQAVTTFEGCNFLDPKKVSKKWNDVRL